MPLTRGTPPADVFARTVPMTVERHYFGENKGASLARVETDTDKALLILTKRILRMPETSAIRQRDIRFRDWLTTVAMPFRPGLWLVPVGMVERADAAARAWQTERHELVEVAAAAYPQTVATMASEAREQRGLASQFNPLDYPSADVFKAHYWVEWRFVDFGVPNMLREISAVTFERERVKLEQAGAEARQMIEQHLSGSLLKITDHLVKLLQPKANGDRRALREGALDDLLTFLDTIALRDVTNFRQLQAVTATLRETANGITVGDLRDNDALRERTAQTIEAARDIVASLVTEGRARAIRVRDEEPAEVV